MVWFLDSPEWSQEFGSMIPMGHFQLGIYYNSDLNGGKQQGGNNSTLCGVRAGWDGAERSQWMGRAEASSKRAQSPFATNLFAVQASFLLIKGSFQLIKLQERTSHQCWMNGLKLHNQPNSSKLLPTIFQEKTKVTTINLKLFEMRIQHNTKSTLISSEIAFPSSCSPSPWAASQHLPVRCWEDNAWHDASQIQPANYSP